MFTKRTVIRIGALAGAICAAAGAQQTAPTVSLPLPLAGVHYRYWPAQMMQTVGPELPYSTIVANIDDRGKEPICDVQLVSKDGKTVVHYTNLAQELAADRNAGFKAYKVPMQIDSPGAPTKGAQYLIRFNTEKNVPVVWQFVVGTEVTERGRGVSPANPGYPALVYRNEGGLAGGGTALKVGDKTSVAELWQEIAQQPYFVPYHGTISTGVQVLNFLDGPAQLNTVGDSVTDDAGEAFQTTRNGDTVTLVDAVFATSASYDLSGGAVTHMSFGPLHAKGDESMNVQLSPALALDGQSSFEILVGKKNKIASGSVHISANKEGKLAERWTFTSPDALHGAHAEALVMVKR